MEQIKHRDFDKVTTFLSDVDKEFAKNFKEMQRLIPEKLLMKLHKFDEYKYTNKNYDYSFGVDNENGFLYLTITKANKIYLLEINSRYLEDFSYILLAEKDSIASFTTIIDDKVHKIKFESENWPNTKSNNDEPKAHTYLTRRTADFVEGEEPFWHEIKSFKIRDIQIDSGHAYNPLLCFE